MSKYKNKKLTCPYCTNEFFNQRGDRLSKYCSISCARKNQHKLNGKKTFNVANWKLREYQKAVIECELCGRLETTNSSNKTYNPRHRNKLCRDHNHVTGNFRGVLCSTCNRALGWYENRIEKVHDYLEKYNDFKVVISKIDNRIREQ